ncbi:MAG: hypothetical protein KBD30_00535 [Legionellaceae bacterium]|nr:hypothetical protein [Legionellaceae bacterium]
MPNLIAEWRAFLIDNLKTGKTQDEIKQVVGGTKGDLSRIFQNVFPTSAVEKEVYERFQRAISKRTLESIPIVEEEEKQSLKEEVNAYVQSEALLFSKVLFNESLDGLHPGIIAALGESNHSTLLERFGSDQLMSYILQSALMYTSQMILQQHEAAILANYPETLSLIRLDSKPDLDGMHQSLQKRLPVLALHGDTIYYIYEDVAIEGDGVYQKPVTDAYKMDEEHQSQITHLFPARVNTVQKSSKNCLENLERIIGSNQRKLRKAGFWVGDFAPRPITIQGELQLKGFNYNLYNNMQARALNITAPEIRTLTVDYQLQQLNAIQQELEDVIVRLTKFRLSRWDNDPRNTDIDTALRSLEAIQSETAQKIKNTAPTARDIQQLSLETFNAITLSLNKNIFEKPALKEAYGIFERIMTAIINFINGTDESAVELAVKPLFKYAELSTHGSDEIIAESSDVADSFEDDKHRPRSNSMG